MKKSLNILLVEPRNEEILTGSGGTAPLWPGVLTALTPPGHKVDFVQCSFEELTAKRIAEYDLVGISSRTDTANHAYRLGDLCKRLEVPCVMGGIHPFVSTEETKRHCDSIVLGEAENIWPIVVADAQANTLKYIYRGERPNPDELCSPDLRVVSKYKYAIENIVETVRGCPYNCSFCSATLYNGKRYRYKPVDRVLGEIECWKNQSSLALFADLNVISNIPKAKDLLRELAAYDIFWWGNASINVAEDDELLKLLSDSGCRYLGLGFESISDETLRSINKKHNTKYDYKTIIKRLHDHNIDVFGNFIFGLDTDTPDVFKKTVDFVIESGVDFPVFQLLVPYPGTKVFEAMKAENRVLTEDWSKYTRSDVVFQHPNMSGRQLIEGLFWAYQQAYSSRSLLKHFLSRWRGVKKSAYNVKILSHFAKQIENVKEYHTRKVAALNPA